MGLFGRKRRSGVRGVARVVSSAQPPHATHGSLRMTVVVEAPGIAPFSTDFSKFAVRVDKWPTPGDVLPVEVDPDDHEIEVLWDEIPTHRESARQDADRLASMLRQQQGYEAPPAPGGGPGTPGGPVVGGGAGGGVGDMVSQLQQMFPGATINVGDATVVDPNAAAGAGADVGPGVPVEPPPFGSPQPPQPPQPPGSPGIPPPGVPGAPGVRVVASQSGGDPVERLEKLARLRDAGVVDQAQFEQLRAQILGQAGLDGG